MRVISPPESLISIGSLQAYDTTFLPSLPNHFETFYPTLVSYSNLGYFVQALSNPQTPQDIRQRFYDHNPIPCTIWNSRQLQDEQIIDNNNNNDNSFPVPKNPDHIMPQNFGVHDLRNDVQLIMESMELIERKYPKYICEGRVINDKVGLASMLVSNDMGDARCSDLVDPIDYRN